MNFEISKKQFQAAAQLYGMSYAEAQPSELDSLFVLLFDIGLVEGSTPIVQCCDNRLLHHQSYCDKPSSRVLCIATMLLQQAIIKNIEHYCHAISAKCKSTMSTECNSAITIAECRTTLLQCRVQRFNGDGLYVEEYKKNEKLVTQGKKVERMFTLNVNMPEMNAAMFSQGTCVVANIEIWHERIGHANVQMLKLMQSKELVTGLPQLRVSETQQVCAACQLGKQAKRSFPQEIHVSKNLLEVIHSDVWGPTKNTSMGGCRFYITFIDDCSCKVWIYFLKEKSEVFTHFQNFKAMVEKQTGSFVQCLRSDGGGEYFSHEFSNFLKKHGIQRQFSCRYTPQQNGVAECKNKHIARALMSGKNMPHVIELRLPLLLFIL
ncbi:hypothetical protein L7F22_041322 [Adiantum nelumboides]|nr:hypothetical protein [Adiantum nelumboides]